MYEPEGGFAAMRAAPVAARRRGERRGVEIRELEHRLAVARVAEREERERHARPERSNGRALGDGGGEQRRPAAAANASVAAIEARWDA